MQAISRTRLVVAFCLLVGLFSLWFATAQDMAQVSSTQDLKLVTIGNGKTRTGHDTAFRNYEAPDGNKGQVVYTQFDSLRDAQKQIEEWIKATSKVTSREQSQSKSTQRISDRILGVGELPDSHKKKFVIIRRDGLQCYMIESVSFQLAKKIENLIERK
jgi:phage terminase large subunit-like protein